MRWPRPLSWVPRITPPSFRARRPRRGPCRPRLETLEDRWVPTTVTNLNDSGIGSLRDAISVTQPGGTIDFAPGLTGTITLFTNELTLTKNVTINGPGANLITISGNNFFKIFFDELATVTINGLTMANGNSANDPLFPFEGGGITNLSGRMTLNNCVLINNHSPVSTIPSVPFSAGGAIFNTFLLTPGVMTLNNTLLTGNVVNNGTGGAIDNDATCTVTLNNSTVTNSSGTDLTGGGIYNLGRVNLNSSTVSTNVTSTSRAPGVGAGIFNNGTLVITQSTVSGNVSPGDGGGIYTAGGSLTVINSTISGNQALSHNGGGLWNNNTTINLTDVTVANNTAARGGGLYLTLGSVPQVTLRNTIVATNTPGTVGAGPDIAGNVNQANSDLIGDGRGMTGIAPNDGNNNQVGTGGMVINPLLGRLQNNGGPTQTQALLTGSPAIDAGDNTFVPPGGDQRGLNRIINNTVDIGAYEYQPPDTTTTLSSSLNPSIQGQAVMFTAQVMAQAPGSNTPAGPVTFFDGSTALATISLNNTGTAVYTTSTLAPGVHTITASYGGFIQGDYKFNSSPSNPVSQTVKGITTVALVSSLNPANTDQPVTFTATVTTTASGTPTGTVTFFDGGTPLGSPVNLVGNTATLPPQTFTKGQHPITATYNGDSLNAPGNSNSVNQLVGPTVTQLVAAPNPANVNDSITVTATVRPQVAGTALTPGGTVTFYDGGSPLGSASLSGGVATVMVGPFSAGTHSLSAIYNAEDVNFLTSTSNGVSEVVGGTMTTLTSSPNPSATGQTVNFVATVTPLAAGFTPPGGTVTFFDGGTQLGSPVGLTGNTATLPYSALAPGFHQITATYSGDPNYTSSTSMMVTQEVGTTITTVRGTPNPARFNQTITLTATITPRVATATAPGGMVTFFDGSTPLGNAPVVAGVASLPVSTLAPGTHSITASYTGDPSFFMSTSTAFRQTVEFAYFVVGGAPGHVLVYRPDNTLVADFQPYGPSFTGPITVAVGDVIGDGYYDIVTGAAVGNPDVRVFSGKDIAQGTFNPFGASLLAQWFPYAIQFNVGANVAVGDINGDGFADIVTGATVGNPDVRVYNGRDIANHTFNPAGASQLAQFFPYALGFNVGANVAVGDVNGDGFADIVTGATAGNPDVRVYNGRDIATGTFNPNGASQLAQWFAYGLNFNVGAFVAVGDTNGDGFGDVITGASVGAPDVRVFDGHAIANGTFDSGNPFASQLDQFFAFAPGVNVGVSVGAADFENNGHADIITGATDAAPYYRVVRANSSGFLPPSIFEGIPADLTGGIFVGA